MTPKQFKLHIRVIQNSVIAILLGMMTISEGIGRHIIFLSIVIIFNIGIAKYIKESDSI
jgi:hypothetical protein